MDKEERRCCILYCIFHEWEHDRLTALLRMLATRTLDPIPDMLVQYIPELKTQWNRLLAEVCLRLLDGIADGNVVLSQQRRLFLLRTLVALVFTHSQVARLTLLCHSPVTEWTKTTAPNRLMATEALPRLVQLVDEFGLCLPFGEKLEELHEEVGVALDLTLAEFIDLAAVHSLEEKLKEKYGQSPPDPQRFVQSPGLLAERLFGQPFLTQFAGIIYHYSRASLDQQGEFVV